MERDKHGRPLPRSNRGGDRDQHTVSSSNTSSRRDDPPRSNTWEGNNQHSSMNLNASGVVAVATPAGSSGNTNASKWGNTYGLTQTYLESLWITGPLVSKVFVANVSFVLAVQFCFPVWIVSQVYFHVITQTFLFLA